MHKSFNKRKIDRIPISNEILEFIKKYYPSIEEAAVARMFLSNLQVVMDLPCRKQYKYEWESVTKNIKYARKSVLMNKKAKTKMRIMAACSYMGIMPLKILGEIYNLVINKILKC